MLVCARVLPPYVLSNKTMVRLGHLDPYGTETIIDDARRSGPGSHFELVLSPEGRDIDLADVERLSPGSATAESTLPSDDNPASTLTEEGLDTNIKILACYLTVMGRGTLEC